MATEGYLKATETAGSIWCRLFICDFSLPGQEVLPPTELAPSSGFFTQIHRRVVIFCGSQRAIFCPAACIDLAGWRDLLLSGQDLCLLLS